jgi:fructokinase
MKADHQALPDRLSSARLHINPEKRPAIAGNVGTCTAAGGVEFAGQSVLNVVWHLRSLGFEPLLITRIGNDAEGGRISRHLEKWGIDLAGVQVDDSLPTFGPMTSLDEGEHPRCAWDALDWKSAADIIHRIEPAVLFHGVAATNSETIRNGLNSIQNRTTVPFFADLDLDSTTLSKRAVRRALLGVKWIRIASEHLHDLIGDVKGTVPRSTLDEARAVQARFAFEGIVVEQRGLPILGVWSDKVSRGTVSPPSDPSFLPGGRDAATAALIAGLLVGWQGRIMIERAAQFACLAGTDGIAERVDAYVYSAILRYWSGSEVNATES